MFPVGGEGYKRFSLIELFEVGRSILSLNLSRLEDLLLIWATSSVSNTLKKNMEKRSTCCLPVCPHSDRQFNFLHCCEPTSLGF